MPFTFIDRIARKPGRIRIVPENGGSAYYATMERADEPTVEGSPLNAWNLNQAQETLAYQDSVGTHTFKRVYLATNGNDANTGDTTNVPMATIKGAIRKYAKWHKYLDLYLADGTYTETIGTISTDNCSMSIRSTSSDKDKVTINMSAMIETHISQFRLYNITLNMTATGQRAVSVNAGQFYANNTRINMPTTSGSACINVYNGASAFLSECIINSGTGGAVYGNQALHIRAYNCTSERTITLAFHANNGTLIEYSPTMTATTMVREENGGKCIELSARSGSVKGTVAALSGQYMTYDGLLMQWGTVTISPTASNTPTTAVVTFPIAFSGTPTVFLTPITTVPENIAVGVVRSGDLVNDPKKAVGVTLTRSGTTSTGINWFAIGPGSV